MCASTFANVATNAGAAGVGRGRFVGADFAPDEPLLLSMAASMSNSDGGAEYPVTVSIVGYVAVRYGEYREDVISRKVYRRYG